MFFGKLWLTKTKRGRELMNEYEGLKDSLYNRDLYLSYVQEKAPELFVQMQGHFVGLPNYAVAK